MAEVSMWMKYNALSRFLLPYTIESISTPQNEDWKSSNSFKTLRPKQNGRHFADDIFKCISLNENGWIPIKMSLKFVPKGPINSLRPSDAYMRQ